LLEILQDGECARVGGERVLYTDVRVLAATNRDLEAEIRAGRFRDDLYYRLNVVEIRIPPLRERREEIPALVDHFLKTANAQYGHAVDISPSTMQMLLDHTWPGNIRELENTVKRIAVLGDASQVRQELGAIVRPAALAPLPATVTVAPVSDGRTDLKAIARQAARDAER